MCKKVRDYSACKASPYYSITSIYYFNKYIMENTKLEIKCKKEKPISALRRFAVLLFLCLIIPVAAYSQTKMIHGVVLDELGEPIAGAAVTINGTQKGTITDFDGKFNIEASAENKLSISFIGFIKQEVTVGNNTNLDIRLKEDNTQLEEIVVVGYGTQKKASLTGAVSAVTSKEIAVTKNENVVNMLTGKLPGVRISQISAQPGEFDTKIDIRGMGDPLIVVDGIPRDKDYFSHMDAAEIESVSVLKDASAAIYGLRSANGVLLVTTKRGTSAQSGKFDITYSTNFGWQRFLYVPNTVNAVDYMNLTNENRWRNFDNNYMNRQPAIFSPADIEPYINGSKQSTNFLDAAFDKTTPQQQHNLTLNGSSEKINYFFNLGYMKQVGAYKSGDLNYNRWNFRSNVDAKITKGLTAQVNIGGYMDEKNQPRTDIWTIYKRAWVQQPNVPIYANDNPLYPNYNMKDNENPITVTDAKYTGLRTDKTKVFNGSLALTYEIPGVKGLSARAMYSYDFKYLDKRDYKKSFFLYDYVPAEYGQNGEITKPEQYVPYEKNAPSSIRRESFPDYKRLMQISLNYNRTFLEAHNVSALALFEESYSNWDSFYAFREIMVNSEYLFAGETDKMDGGMYDVGDITSQAFVGKLNYDFKGKYLAEFSFRYDGSSRFPKGKRWGFFPSASVGWRISEENFIKDNFSFVNNVKIRASYGKLGHDGDNTNYPPDIVGFGLDANDRGWIYNGKLMGGVNATSIPNPDLTWTTSKIFDIGIDVDLWNGLLGGSFDYYNRNRDGLPASRLEAVPGTVGANLPKENLGSDRTFGYEIVLTHRNRVADVGYYVNAQLSSTRNQHKTEIESRAGNSFENWKSKKTDRYKDIWWGKDYDGQFTNYDQIYNHPIAIGSGNKVPGDYYYQDWNGDGVINGEDDHPIANYNMPLINYGISLGADWRGIDLNLVFQGAGKVYTEYTEVLKAPLMFEGTALTQFLDRWRPVDPNADLFDPRTGWISGYYPATGGDAAEGTRAVQNASYLRLKTVELGYTIPQKFISRLGIKNLRVYFSGYNLLTFTGLKNTDPEHPGGIGGTSSDQIDVYKYPINKTFNIGASIKF